MAAKKNPAKHEFLSPSWIEAVQKLRHEYRDRVAPPSIPVKANVVVTSTPFGGDLLGHVDTSSGDLAIEIGHLDQAHVKITTDYSTAKSLFVQQDQAAIMQAVMTGKIRVEGDMTKLLALQLPLTEPATAAVASEIATRVKAITA